MWQPENYFTNLWDSLFRKRRLLWLFWSFASQLIYEICLKSKQLCWAEEQKWASLQTRFLFNKANTVGSYSSGLETLGDHIHSYSHHREWIAFCTVVIVRYWPKACRLCCPEGGLISPVVVRLLQRKDWINLLVTHCSICSPNLKWRKFKQVLGIQHNGTPSITKSDAVNDGKISERVGSNIPNRSLS